METISLIIPAYNEEKRLAKTLLLWQKFLEKNALGHKVLEIIIADDGSTDNTVKIAESFKQNLPIKIIKINPNQGKGNAVKQGVRASQGNLVFIYDADAATRPEEIKKLLEYIGKFDFVIGSRTAKGADSKISFIRRIIGACFHIVCWPLISDIKDASCGAKLLRKTAAEKIFSEQKIKRFAFDVEILWLAKKYGIDIKEVGLKWKEIPGSKVKIFKDGAEMFISVLGLYKRQLLG